jgi:hypothetical protein
MGTNGSWERKRREEEREELQHYLTEERQDFDHPKIKAVRDLFELLAFYGLVWGAAFAVGLSLEWLLAFLPLPPDAGSPLILCGIVIFAIAVSIFWSFDGAAGRQRKAKWMTTARTYGYPITLLVGCYVGWQYHAYDVRYSDETIARRAAESACTQVPDCLTLATRARGGDDVLQYLRSH